MAQIDDVEEAIITSRSELKLVYYWRRAMLAHEARNVALGDIHDALKDIKDVLLDIHEELKP